MKYLVQILLFINFTFIGNAQNLITNPSFEEIDSCYGNASPIGFDVFQWSGCDGWTCPTTGSSDLWCENPLLGIINPPGIPVIGYQNAHSGSNFSGILTFEYQTQNYREYIQNKLTEPLKSNQYYILSAYVSATEGDKNFTNCFQAYFSNFQLTISSYFDLEEEPQWKNQSNNYLIDTLSWQLVSGLFKAKGGEQYVTFGCFEDSAQIIVKDKNALTTYDLYYFIDDLNVELAPITIEFPNVFTPTNDEINDLFSPKVIGVEDYKIYVYNRWGNLMVMLDVNNPSWNGKNAKDGTYFYVLKSEKVKVFEQGFFQLIR